ADFPLPPGLTPCGHVVDGTASVVGYGGSVAGSAPAGTKSSWRSLMGSYRGTDVLCSGASAAVNMAFQSCQFSDCGLLANASAGPSAMQLGTVRITNGRAVASGSTSV